MGMEKSLRAAPKIPSEQKNVLLFISDDHGLSELGCYGNPVIQTPALDKLAENGVRFSSAFAAVSSCSPSRSVIYTGLFNHTNGMYGLSHGCYNQHTHRWVKGIANLLNIKGYHTGIIGKNHVQPDEVYGFTTSKIAGKDSGLRARRDVMNMADKAKEFFATTRDKPFFLVVGYFDPHRDWVKANRLDYPGVKKITYSPDDVVIPPFLPDEPEVREEFTQYYESVSRMDQGIGRVMEYLEESGRSENTLVIYVSDNGMPFPGAKVTLYDPGIHLPMLVSAPHLKRRGIVNNAMVSYIDIVPTILDWAQAEGPPYELPGRSILPILEQENPTGWDEIYASHIFHQIFDYYPMRALRTRKYKYILNLAHQLDYSFLTSTWQALFRRREGTLGVRSVESYMHRPKEELYNLEKDPYEVNNIADEPQYAGVLVKMRKKVKAMQKKTNDLWIVKYEYDKL